MSVIGFTGRGGREINMLNLLRKGKKYTALGLMVVLIFSLAACSGQKSSEDESEYIAKGDITVRETYENSADGEHAVETSGESAEYSNIGVTKTGDSEGDEADFYDEN